VIQTGPDRILVAKVISSETSRVFGQMARGAYGHNVWARDGYGKSGAGYFAIGFGAVRHADQAAMKWIYNRFFRQIDQEQGGLTTRCPVTRIWPSQRFSTGPWTSPSVIPRKSGRMLIGIRRRVSTAGAIAGGMPTRR